MTPKDRKLVSELMKRRLTDEDSNSITRPTERVLIDNATAALWPREIELEDGDLKRLKSKIAKKMLKDREADFNSGLRQHLSNIVRRRKASCNSGKDDTAKIATMVKKELAELDATLKKSMQSLDDLSQPARDVIDEMFDLVPDDRSSLPSYERLVDASYTALCQIAWAAEEAEIMTSRGKSSLVEEEMVSGLADLYKMATAKEPSRSFTYPKKESEWSSVGKESGDFLDLARCFAGVANKYLPEDQRFDEDALSGIVRKVLDSRKESDTSSKEFPLYGLMAP